MHNFKKYISESLLAERNNAELHSDLIFQRLLDALDHGHIDFDDDRIEFHVGKLTKNSSINLRCVIRNSQDEAVRLGKDRETDDLVVVVDTPDKLPVRTEIDSFLAKNRERAQGMKSVISDYLRDYHNGEDAPTTKTRYEEEAEANTSANFENRYEVAMKKVKELMKEYREVVAELKMDGHTEDYGKKETVKAAQKILAKEYFGEDSEGFKKIARGLLSKDEHGENTGFANNLSKENKKRLDNRLESFYDQHIKPLLKTDPPFKASSK